MKKMLSIVLIVALALPLMMVSFVSAAADTSWNGTVLFNNSTLNFQSAPERHNGKVYVPLAEISEAVGVTVEQDKLTDVKEINDVIYVAISDFAIVAELYYYENKLVDRNYLMNNEAVLADGEYTVTSTPQGNAADVAHLTLVVEGGKIVDVAFDEQRGTGEWKFDGGNSEYTARWANARDLEPGTPDMLLANIIEEVIKNQTAYGMDADVYTGATSSYKKLANLTSQAIAKAQVDAIETNKPSQYRDGKYVVVGMTDSRGYTPTVEMTIQNGIITEVYYDDYNEAGEGKRGTSYVTNWASRFEGVDPEALIANAEAQLLRNQDPNLVDVMTGATSWYTNFTKLVAGALDQAARLDYEAEEVGFNDGVYWAHGEESRGYVPLLMVRFVDGEIVDVKFHDISTTNGLSKRYNSDYFTGWINNERTQEALNGRHPLTILDEMEAYVVENQSFDIPADVSTGATSWATNIENLGEAALVSANQETIYVFVGDPDGSAYARQFLVIERAGELVAMDYIEYHRGHYAPKMAREDYIGPTSRWVENRAEELNGKLPLEILDELMDFLWENQSVEGIDGITGATNWNSGIKLLAPKAFDLVQ